MICQCDEFHMNSSHEKYRIWCRIQQCFLNADPRDIRRLFWTQLSLSSLHFGDTTLGVSVLASGSPHLSGPVQHGGPVFNLDVPQRQGIYPTQNEQHALCSSILQVCSLWKEVRRKWNYRCPKIWIYLSKNKNHQRRQDKFDRRIPVLLVNFIFWKSPGTVT